MVKDDSMMQDSHRRQAIKIRVKEIEEEVEKIQAMQNENQMKVQKGAAAVLRAEDKAEVDLKSVWVGMWSKELEQTNWRNTFTVVYLPIWSLFYVISSLDIIKVWHT